LKLSDMMPHADLPPWTEYLEAWEKEHKPVYPIFDECLHESTVMTQKVDTLGHDHYRLRCLVCGRMVKPIKKVDALKILDGSRAPNDEHTCAQVRHDPDNDYFRMRSYLRDEYYRLSFQYPQKLIEQRSIYYRRYLKTARWKKLAAAVFDRDNNTCQSCGSTDLLHCHHNTYVRLSVEEMSDLITYCARCHNNHHTDQDMERERERLWRENQLTINQQLSE
jgi:5-methylcytosine-specific restriction endonuclease McrA